MKVSDRLFTLEKIEKYLKEDIYPSRVCYSQEIACWRYLETTAADASNDTLVLPGSDEAFSDFELWDTWGGYDQTAWFKAEVELPSDPPSGHLALHFVVGPRDGGDSTAEALLYVNGEAIQGIDIWHEEAILPERFCQEKNLSIALKAWSGVLKPPKFRTFKQAALIYIHPQTDRFYHAALALLGAARTLEEGDLKRIEMTKLLNSAFGHICFLNPHSDAYYSSVVEALCCLEKGLEHFKGYNEMKPTVTCVGHSHIDMAWLWRLSATREKASRTFSTVLNLMEQYPEYRFMHSSPQLYQFLKTDYPQIFERVQSKIRTGQWEITGGMWVEPDTNLPSGESLVRQFLFGKRFIEKEFDQTTKVVWLPDVFGYSAQMPQIIKKSGMDYFMTTKISWNQFNHFPYDTFMWHGLDGTGVLTHFITTPENGSWYYTYNGTLTPEEIPGIWRNYKQKEVNDELLLAYGWGDGGGGPTREMLETARALENLPGIPYTQLDKVEPFFERLNSKVNGKPLDAWRGELYFEYHRGTYTSQAHNKKCNRRIEELMHLIECAYAILLAKGWVNAYPQVEINAIWERILNNQFHDVLPGSSIREVYEDTKADYEALFQSAQSLLQQAITAWEQAAKQDETMVTAFNASSYDRTGLVLLPYANGMDQGMTLASEKGLILPCQATENGLLVNLEEVPAYGHASFRKVPAVDVENRLSVTTSIIETPFYHIELDEMGQIALLFDKQAKREVGTGDKMNVFEAYEDKPLRFDAWDIDVFYQQKPYRCFELTELKVCEAGPIRGVLRRVIQFNQSKITQDMIVYANSRRIDFKTSVDWHEKQVLLKASFPVNIHAMDANFEIQYGHIARANHNNDERDFAQFEVCAHRFADVSEADYGVALLNDCKYGYDVKNSVMRLTLIKSAVRPDALADQGLHEFTYAIYPHEGNLVEAKVVREAEELNTPLRVLQGFSMEAFSAFGVNKSNIILDTVKKAEDSNDLVLRLYENSGKHVQGQLSIHPVMNVKAVVEANLMEQDIAPIKIDDNTVSLDLKPFEIKTLLLKQDS